MDELPKTRKEAIALGKSEYFTGKSCKWGHLVPRLVNDRNCPVCRNEYC